MQTARVNSIQALEEFRSAFLAFSEQVQEALCSIDHEGQKTLNWVLRDQTARWQRAIRDRQGDVAKAKAALFRRELTKISGSHPDLIEEKKAVRTAQEQLKAAEQKLANCKRWGFQLLPRILGEFQGPERQLKEVVEGEHSPAVLFLDRVLASLDAYVQLAAPQAQRPAGKTRGPVTLPADPPAPAPEAALPVPPAQSGESPAPPAREILDPLD
jgi:hypothetical protein